jgi:spermidine synthase
VLADPRVRSLVVVEALGDVIGWHVRGLLPHAAELTSDPRCALVEADFFATVAAGAKFAPHEPRRVHAVLVDIDHSPRHVLHPSSAAFYRRDGLRRLADRLHPGGVFGLWSDDPPDDDFLAVLREVFATVHAHVVSFANPYTGDESSNTVYVATIP